MGGGGGGGETRNIHKGRNQNEKETRERIIRQKYKQTYKQTDMVTLIPEIKIG